MLREIRDLGFEYAELSHGIRISLLPGILDAVDAGEIKISSLHNFCPLPMGVNQPAPNLFQFSSQDPRERESAYKHTLRTIETAGRLKAPIVVMHMGSVEMRDYTDRLMEMLEKGDNHSPKYDKLCSELLEKREEKKEKFVENTAAMLERLIEPAQKHGVKLAVENREALEEIPFETDLSLFFKRFPSPNVVYWHDTGHAQIKQNLGFVNHRLLLESMSNRLAGFHVHDVKFPGRDHCVPGAGEIDYTALKSLIKPEHIKVFELSPSAKVDDVKAGIAHLKGIWGDE
ncbi:MAG: sugar phosphate isomerase/epimerase family protein [Limisphaerales bacterium]